MSIYKKILAATLVASGLVAWAASAAAEQRFVSIGTGGITGVYYPAGGAICRFVNKDRKTHGIRCSVESTGGSIFNINTIRSGELEFGVAQSDMQYQAVKGIASFDETGAYKDLRAVFSIHPEAATIVARDDSKAKNVTDLKGKRVNIGNQGTGTRNNWEEIEKSLGWKREDLKLAGELKTSETAQALCDNKLDAYIWTIGHPSALIQETLATCPSHLVNISDPAIDKLVSDKPYFRKVTIPTGTYSEQESDIVTFGVGATLVTSAKIPENDVYVLVKAVFENFDDFKKLHPAFANLKEQEMISDSLSAPLHPGAKKYYMERGWM